MTDFDSSSLGAAVGVLQSELGYQRSVAQRALIIADKLGRPREVMIIPIL